jgi:hypothetical protein
LPDWAAFVLAIDTESSPANFTIKDIREKYQRMKDSK